MADTMKPVVFITGCSSGLGLALGEVLLATKQFRIVLTARATSIEFLKKRFFESDLLMIRELDICDETQRNALVAEVLQKWKSVDVLINNAGICYRSVIEHMDDESEIQQLQTNYLGPMALVRLVVPPMRERGHGKIINISSVSGMMAMPTMASYSASKHALEGASEALWYEMKPFGIKVSIVQPGFINSNSFQRVYFSKKAELSSHLEGPYSDYYQNMGPFIEKIMSLSLVNHYTIAKKILKLIRSDNPPLWFSATPDATVFAFLRKIVPRRLFHGLMYFLLPRSRQWGSRHTKIKRLIRSN